MREKIADATGPIFDEIVRYPVRSLVTAITVTATAAGLTAAVGGDSAAVSLTVGCGITVGLLLIIYGTVRKMRGMAVEIRKLRTGTGVLQRYIDMTTRQMAPDAFTIDDWEESVTVKKNGDTTVERWITVIVGKDELVSCYTANFQTARMTDKQRSRVCVKAHEFESNRTIGAPYEITDKWEDSKQTIYIHFRQGLPKGGVARIWVRWTWPGFYKSLLDGVEPEPVEWRMGRKVRHIKSSLIFASDCGIHKTRNFNVSPLLGSPAPTQQRRPDASISIEVEYHDVAAGSQLGYVLDNNDPVA